MSLRLTRLCRLPLRPWRVMSASSDFSSSFSASPSFSSTHRPSGGSGIAENPLATKVRRHQSHLPGEQPLPDANKDSQNGGDDDRGGPRTLEQLQLRVLSKDEHFVVLNKGPDERMDGAFDVTLEKALSRDFPDVPKFRWIHQLDFATSGVLVVGATKEATATGCRLFREKQVQKEYLAVVRGHLPFNPADSVDRSGVPAKACTFSKLGLLIQDMEELERLRNQQRGTRTHQKMADYPRRAPWTEFVHNGASKIAA